jgi:hypothetical protein
VSAATKEYSDIGVYDNRLFAILAKYVGKVKGFTRARSDLKKAPAAPP